MRRKIRKICLIIAITCIICFYLIVYMKVPLTESHTFNWKNQRKLNINISSIEQKRKFWKAVSDMINTNELFSDNYDVEEVLQVLRTTKILKITRLKEFAALKWILHLEGGAKAVFKPSLAARDYNHFVKESVVDCNYGYEQPKSEIAAFHINRMLGMRLAPYTTGRILSLDTEVWPVADEATRNTIIQNGTSLCLNFRCYTCNKLETVTNCPKDNKIYGSVKYWIPRRIQMFKNADNKFEYHLYQKTYIAMTSIHGWVTDGTYCDKFRKQPPFDKEKIFLDVVDSQVIDFLIYHYDSKYTAMVDEENNVLMTLLLDYGLAFCKGRDGPIHTTLLSLYQCCQLRQKTYDILMSLRGSVIGEIFNKFTENEIERPILEHDDIIKMQNQVEKVLKVVAVCSVYKDGLHNVLVKEHV